MKSKRTTQLLCRPLLVLALFGGRIVELSAQQIRLDAFAITNGTVQFTVTGMTNGSVRVDSSPDLKNWTPIDGYSSTGTARLETDALDTSGTGRYYRAAQTDGQLKVLGFSPVSGPPGTLVTLVGAFFPAPTMAIVRLGSAQATVVSGTPTRLVVRVPANALSGPISVTSSAGSQTTRAAFAVTGDLQITFTPPGGVAASDFQFVNSYGTATALTNSQGIMTIPVRVGVPTVTYATPIDTNRPVFFALVTLDTTGPATLSAASTAEALVFQNPFLMTSDPNLAGPLLGVIHTNAAVQALSQLLVQKLAQSPDAMADPDVRTAYQKAVVSVASASAVQAMALASARPAGGQRRGLMSQGNSALIYPIEAPATRFIEVTAEGLKLSPGVEEGFFNPVEWLVAFQQVDVEAAFPNGRTDFIKALATETFPQTFPLEPAYYTERPIPPNFASSRLNFLGTAVDAALSALIPKFIDDSVVLPSADGIYLVRGVGPGFRSADDLAFVTSEMNNIYIRAVAFNIASAAMELAGLTAGEEDEKAVSKLAAIQGLAADVLKRAPGVLTPEDFETAAFAVAESLINDFMKDQVKTVAGKVLKFISENLESISSKLEKAASIGQLAERVAGLGRTTALETSFVVVGDPFGLQILNVQPNVGSPDQDIQVKFKGPPSLHAFDTNNAQDTVTFIGTSRQFDGQVWAVTGPDAQGIQTLTLRIPGTLGSSGNGNYTMFVNTQGRSGSAPFTVSLAAALRTVTPQQGFAATPDFAGNPYSGTKVHLQGAVFTTSDTFFFAGGAGGVAASSPISGGASSGDVFVHVPTGATTGPLRIQHPLTDGTLLQITGPVFTVLGPPRILSVSPGSAPPGMTLNLAVTNAGTDPTAILAQFTGSQALSVSVLGNGVITVGVPNAATNGSLAILTPAGKDQVPFTVLPPVPFTGQQGASIAVGGDSVVTLSRAIAFANGDATPLDDADFIKNPDGSITSLDPPYEEGDFVSPDNHDVLTPRWPVGSQYSDAINLSGTNTESVDFVMSYDGVYGNSGALLTGSIVVSGHNNVFSGGTFSGPVVVTGYSNQFNSVTFRGPVTVQGNFNSFDHDYVSGGMTLAGEGNGFNFTYFTNCPGHALTVSGNRNTGLINLWTNSGDGLRIEGGKYNSFQVNNCLGNGGNGVTLTGGAEGNTIQMLTGTRTPGSGNRGHGLAILGSAVANVINNYSGGIAGNDLDGVYMDGPGVTANRFALVELWYNGRNGLTITNGASLNVVGDPHFDNAISTTVPIHNNGGNGVALLSCGPNLLGVTCRSNALNGVLISGVKVDPGTLGVFMLTGGKGPSNGKAGLRLEQGTTGARVRLYNSPMFDAVGVELDGEDVAGNLIDGGVSSNLVNGVVLRGAHDNELDLTIGGNGGDGLLLQGASRNLFRIDGPNNCASNGVHFTQASFGNHITSRSGAPFNTIINNNLNGIVFDTDSHDNSMELVALGTNRLDGLVFSGASHNQFVRSSVGGVARDGIRFEKGALGNVIGSDADDDQFQTREIYIGGCGAAGVHVLDPGTADNILRRCMIASGIQTQPIGVLVEGGAEAGLITRSTFQLNVDGIVLRDGASQGVLSRLLMLQNTNSAITISNAANILIGGAGALDANDISQSQVGIDIAGAGGTNNSVINNQLCSARWMLSCQV